MGTDSVDRLVDGIWTIDESVAQSSAQLWGRVKQSPVELVGFSTSPDCSSLPLSQVEGIFVPSVDQSIDQSVGQSVRTTDLPNFGVVSNSVLWSW